jgi:hypothetical protein
MSEGVVFMLDFNTGVTGYHIPFVELKENGMSIVNCCVCRVEFTEDVFCDGIDGYYCEDCMDKLIESLETEAMDYAEKHCKITETIPKYYPEHENRCTPEEYEMGYRDSYTPNAHLCCCRHNCTNYDELIRNLSRDEIPDKVYYTVIRNKIDELIEESISNMVHGDDDRG